MQRTVCHGKIETGPWGSALFGITHPKETPQGVGFALVPQGSASRTALNNTFQGDTGQGVSRKHLNSCSFVCIIALFSSVVKGLLKFFHPSHTEGKSVLRFSKKPASVFGRTERHRQTFSPHRRKMLHPSQIINPPRSAPAKSEKDGKYTRSKGAALRRGDRIPPPASDRRHISLRDIVIYYLQLLSFQLSDDLTAAGNL